MAVYNYAHDYALKRGIIIADTKFEFGFANGKLMIIDELLTPDSSCSWEANKYVIGKSQLSFDKQPVKDWLISSGWNKEPPTPQPPDDVIQQTFYRYKTAFIILTGENLQIPD